MQLGIAALFIIWMISRSNLSTSPSPTNTPSWVLNNPTGFPVSFVQGVDRGVIGIQRWTGTPEVLRLYVRYGAQGPITPLVGTYTTKDSAIRGAGNWINTNAPPSGSLQNVKAPEAPPEEAPAKEEVIQDFTLISPTGVKTQAINQQAETLSLNGTQEYALNG